MTAAVIPVIVAATALTLLASTWLALAWCGRRGREWDEMAQHQRAKDATSGRWSA